MSGLVEKKRINVYVSVDVYKEFKSVCALMERSLSEVVEHNMDQTVKAWKKLSGSESVDSWCNQVKRPVYYYL